MGQKLIYLIVLFGMFSFTNLFASEFAPPLQNNSESPIFLRGHSDQVQAASFSLDGKRLASSSTDHNVMIWNVQSHQLSATLQGHQSTVYGVAFSKVTDRLVASGSSNGQIILWDAFAAKKIADLTTPNQQSGILSMEFSPVEDILAATLIDGSIQLWDTQTKTLLSQVMGHNGGYVLSVHFLPDGQSLITTGGMDSEVKIWSKRLELVERFGGHMTSSGPLWNSAVSSDGDTIAASCSDGSIKIWHKGEYQIANEIYIHTYLVLGLVFSPDNSELFASTAGAHKSEEGNYIMSLDIKSGQSKIRWSGHQDRIRNITISPDGKTIASASWDGTIGLWDL